MGDFDIRAFSSTKELLIICAACAKRNVYVYAIAARLINRFNMEREQCIFVSLYWWSWYVFAQMHFDYKILFQNILYNVS